MLKFQFNNLSSGHALSEISLTFDGRNVILMRGCCEGETQIINLNAHLKTIV